MKTSAFVYAALFAATVVQAHDASQDTVKNISPAWNPESSPDAVKRMLKSVTNHDQVQPFAQPEATTLFDKAGVKFKPQLHIAHGCQSYAFVDAAGHTSGGLEPSGKDDGSCEGSKHGSQVYGRVTGHFQYWTIMYLYYFPKTR